MSRKSWIPWPWIQRLHSAHHTEALTALFSAYQNISSTIDIEGLASDSNMDQESSCIRCGACCAELNPGPKREEKYNKWKSQGIMAHMFYREIPKPKVNVTQYTGWFFGSVKLRMCPLLFMSADGQGFFCSVYHQGPGHRPVTCENFKANPPHCEVSQRPLVP